jgi:hypothetical protein
MAFGFDEEDRVSHDYHDHSKDKDFHEYFPTCGFSYHHLFPQLAGGRGNREPFPVKLHSMLKRVEDEGMTSIVSWQPHGRCFVVRQQEEFVEHILKR